MSNRLEKLCFTSAAELKLVATFQFAEPKARKRKAESLLVYCLPVLAACLAFFALFFFSRDGIYFHRLVCRYIGIKDFAH
jgi:hypothetical protein